MLRHSLFLHQGYNKAYQWTSVETGYLWLIPSYLKVYTLLSSAPHQQFLSLEQKTNITFRHFSYNFYLPWISRIMPSKPFHCIRHLHWSKRECNGGAYADRHCIISRVDADKMLCNYDMLIRFWILLTAYWLVTIFLLSTRMPMVPMKLEMDILDG